MYRARFTTLCLCLFACGVEEEFPSTEAETATAELTFGQPMSTATSVRVVGVRVNPTDVATSLPALNRYRCDSSFDRCLSLGTTDTVLVSDLCSSTAMPNGLWNFTYSLFSGNNCTGTHLNGAATYLQCFDSQDIFLRLNLNMSRGKSVAALGTNPNSILCAVSKLTVATQPVQTIVREVMNPGVSFQITNAFGVAVATSGVPISLAIASGPGSFGALATTQVNTNASGRATFSNLSFTVPGNYVLTASSPGILPVQTASFTVTPAYLQYAATGTLATRTSSGNFTVPYPAGSVANDLLFLVGLNGMDKAFTTPTGWTLLVDQTQTSGGKFRSTVWWRNAGSETSVSVSVQTDSNGASAWVVRYNRPGATPTAASLATATPQAGLANAATLLTPSPDVTTNQTYATVISFSSIRASNTLSLNTARGFVFRDWETSNPKTAVGFAIADTTVANSATAVASPTWSQSGTAVAWAWATAAFR